MQIGRCIRNPSGTALVELLAALLIATMLTTFVLKHESLTSNQLNRARRQAKYYRQLLHWHLPPAALPKCQVQQGIAHCQQKLSNSNKLLQQTFILGAKP